MGRRTANLRTKRRSILGWLLPFMALAVSLGLAYGAYNLASYSWDQVVSYESPYTTQSGIDFSGPRPDLADPIPDAQPRRVVLVLIDGLRDDASRTMASISGLRARGADVHLTVPQPSLSYPTWTTILTGAPQQISGVTTNWYEGPVEVETLFDVAVGSGRSVVISGPVDLDEMYSASEVATATSLIEWDNDAYSSDKVVDNALALDAEVGGADFIFVLLPDVDNAGHNYGGSSAEYADVVAKVDVDLARLIEGLDDGATTFVVLPDHGHIDVGGHGGWEEPVTRTFAALAGPGVAQIETEANLEDIAPTVAVIAGMQAPLQGTGTAIDAVLTDQNGAARNAEFVRSAGITLAYVRRVLGDEGVRGIESIGSPADLASMRADADAERLAKERDSRKALLIGAIVAVLVAAAVIGIASWRALVAALVGTAVYAAVYNALFFGAHRLTWSLSAFNEETMLDAFFNQRMLETVLAGVAACLVAALVYAALRKEPRGPQSGYAVEWLALGSATVLMAQAALVVQVAYFLWQWGAQVTWILPNMQAAFKYDLDLIQLTALGAAAVIGPPLTWLVGRIHPRTRRTAAEAGIKS
ncbi:MAG: alkaline phosphatase family protein [Coriobacteriia bacterium]|nr:alkaline phosphatase family protein [Coriobacteriia bacterium]